MVSRPIHIAGVLRTRINQLAHQSGQLHAIEVKARLIAELQALAAAGARFDQLSQHLDRAAGA